jgi:DNA-directed RNA polymerase subunit beta'
MILGCYYVTAMDSNDKGSGSLFASIVDAGLAYEAGAITMKSAIKVRLNGEIIETCYGRLLFDKIVPEELGFVNETIGKGALKKVLARSFDEL